MRLPAITATAVSAFLSVCSECDDNDRTLRVAAMAADDLPHLVRRVGAGNEEGENVDVPQRSRLLLVATVIVTMVIMTAAVASGADRSTNNLSVSSGSQTATITVKSVYFEPYDLRLTAGIAVVLEFVNDGTMSHDLVIEGINAIDNTVAAGSGSHSAQSTLAMKTPGTVRLVAEKGQSVRATFIPRAGKFDFYCSDAGHRGAGLRGTIVVD